MNLKNSAVIFIKIENHKGDKKMLEPQSKRTICNKKINTIFN